MTSPRVSVLMPVYNSARFLQQAMDSILCQTYSDFELIAVDDGSRDASLDMLGEYAARDPRVTVVSRPNTGIVGALNDAIHAARGEFLARMDADDISLPARFELQVKYLEEHPDCVAVGAQVELIDPYGMPLAVRRQELTHEAIVESLLRGDGAALVHPVVMLRACAVTQVGGYRAEYELVEDLDLYLRLAEIGRLANLSELLLLYRQHYDSINRRQGDLQMQRLDRRLRDAHAARGTVYQRSPGVQPHLSEEEQRIKWGWIALRSGRRDVALRHAWHRLRLQPLSVTSWKFMVRALAGKAS